MQYLSIVLAFAAVVIYIAFALNLRPKIPLGCYFFTVGLTLNAMQKLTVLLTDTSWIIHLLDHEILPMLEASFYAAAAVSLLTQSHFLKSRCLREIREQEDQVSKWKDRI